MKSTLLIILVFFFSIIGNSQTLSNSNLPIVIINTDKDPLTGSPAEIPDSYKVWANMKIIYRPDGSRNYATDESNASFLNYNGRIRIELRGSSSQSLPKKPYGLTTYKDDNLSNNNVSILGMPKENDWVLNSIAFDKSLIRNYLSYDLSRSIGEYSPRCVYCEVVINGEYKGLYIFMEKIKIDSERVNIVKMSNTDISLPNLSGGYLTKADKTTGGDPVAWSMLSYNGYTSYLHENPKPTEIAPQQNNYIYNQFTNFQNVMTAQNASITNGYPSIIDVPSFIDFMIINELASNADAYQFSTYFHKDRNGKLRAGPIWDFDLTYGNDLFIWGYDRSKSNVWQFDNGDNTGSKFWKDLFNNQTYKCYLSKRWNELNATGQPLNYTVISTKIDQIVNRISEAAIRENSKWGTIGNHSMEISSLKLWLQSRIAYLNLYWGSYQSCANPPLPPLVISKINYNPLASQSILSDDLEFIEITNNSDRLVNLTGLYFRELGLTYQFPANSAMAAGERIFLASNPGSFQKYYGIIPFGQFSRNLSNNSENIVLADAFGNIIDNVEYLDTAPWPVDADGSGFYLELADINSDNSVGSNWSVSSRIALEVMSNSLEKQVTVYPNPAQSIITISSEHLSFKSFEIFDLSGRKMIAETNINSNQFSINIANLLPNIYILKLHSENGASIVQKINKIP